jgi:hypothetical protein
MSKRRRMASIAFTGAAIAATGTVAHAPAALAASGWKVTPGGAFTATATTVTFTDVTTKLKLTCTSNTMAGDLAVTGSKLGKISKAEFTCTGGLGESKWRLKLSAGTLNATGYRSSVVTGTLTGIRGKLSTLSGASCTAAIAGSQPFSYANATAALRLQGTSIKDSLTTGKVTGCLGQIGSKNKDELGGTFTFKPKQKITAS